MLIRSLLCLLFISVAVGGVAARVAAGGQSVLDRMMHLRSGREREWDEFPLVAEGPELAVAFTSEANAETWTLELVQEDVKRSWQVSLNGQTLGSLHVDENRMRVYFDIAPRTLVSGDNSLRIHCTSDGQPADDVRVGQILVHHVSREQLFSAGRVAVRVRDLLTGDDTPARLTIMDSMGALQETIAHSVDPLATRPGVVYSSTGRVELSLPKGVYEVYAGRGFEYSLARQEIDLRETEVATAELEIQRQVPTEGWVACDPHIHTLTHSGHGDASVEERMVTLVGEGIELPVATDHNVQVDHGPVARDVGVRQYFTPVVGNEVTTEWGHFNVFPLPVGGPRPDHSLSDWQQILAKIYAAPGARVAILNHARDVHSGFRPFGPRWHLALVGENVEGWPIRFNGMEVLNSSATQTDVRQLFEDWLALINRGYQITPVGSSDSHDVARHFVGQGRTYIRCDDRHVDRIDVAEAIDNFLQGQVVVSYGLMAEVRVNGKYGAGEFVPLADQKLGVRVRVLAPDWINASSVALYANGECIKTASITSEDRRDLPAGVAWSGEWEIGVPPHDICLVVMALGPGIARPYWKTAKPYQPESTAWESQVFSCTGPIRVDADGDGRWTAAAGYAQQIVGEADGDFAQILNRLSNCDEAICLHVAHILQRRVRGPIAIELSTLLAGTPAHVQQAFARYSEAWQSTQRARIERP